VVTSRLASRDPSLKNRESAWPVPSRSPVFESLRCPYNCSRTLAGPLPGRRPPSEGEYAMPSAARKRLLIMTRDDFGIAAAMHIIESARSKAGAGAGVRRRSAFLRHFNRLACPMASAWPTERRVTTQHGIARRASSLWTTLRSMCPQYPAVCRRVEAAAFPPFCVQASGERCYWAVL